MKQADVLIIAALREEYDAARQVANGVRDWQPFDTEGAAPYALGEFRPGGGEPLTVAIAYSNDMGARALGPWATRLTELLRPGCLAMSGVCAGRPGTVRGDVVVAQRAYEYDEGKQKGARFLGSHDKFRQFDRWVRAAHEVSPQDLPSFGHPTAEESRTWFLERLLRREDPVQHPAINRYFTTESLAATTAELSAAGLITRPALDWKLTSEGRLVVGRLVKDTLGGPRKLPFEVLTGPMASGSAVVEADDVWDRLAEMGERKVLALEMEAATVATVAAVCEVPNWLVVKGVMDHATADKDDRFKEFAARASAEVLFALLAKLGPAQVTGAARAGRTLGQPARLAAPGGGAGGAGGPAQLVADLPGGIRLQIIRNLGGDWRSLADLAEIKPYEIATFDRGDEGRGILNWLGVRGRTTTALAGLLVEIGRKDLADLIP